MVLCCIFKAFVVSLPGFLSLSETLLETIPRTVLKTWSTSCLEIRELHLQALLCISHMTRAANFYKNCRQPC